MHIGGIYLLRLPVLGADVPGRFLLHSRTFLPSQGAAPNYKILGIPGCLLFQRFDLLGSRALEGHL